MQKIAYLARRGYLGWRLRRVSRFLRETERCHEIQRTRLQQKLLVGHGSHFARDYGLDQMQTVEAFRRGMPVTNYEDYRPYVERVKSGEIDAMFAPSTEVLMFSMTSGTTSASKYVPITNHFFQEYRRSWNYWGLATFRDHPDLLNKYTLTLGSDWQQFFSDAGIPCGSISGLVAETRPQISNSLFLLPAELNKVKGSANKQYLMLRIAIASSQVGMIATANPLTLINLARLADAEKERLIRDVRNGSLSDHIEMGRQQREQLARCYRTANPARAQELEAIVERTGNLYPSEFWPEMSVVSVWMGGAVAYYLPKVRQYFGDVPLRDHGLSASEGHMTSPMEDESTAGLLDYDSHYFEFIPVDQHGAKQPTILEASELETGQDYYILLTTLSGFYRYDIHDVVRCVGFIGKCPKLVFVSKGAHFSSLTGEKLSEVQVTEAVAEALRDAELKIEHFSLVPVPGDPAYYLLLFEQSLSESESRRLVECVEKHLSQVNCEYEDRRASRRLGPVVIGTIPPGTWAEHRRRHSDREGADDYAYKHPFLAAGTGRCPKRFAPQQMTRHALGCGGKTDPRFQTPPVCLRRSLWAAARSAGRWLPAGRHFRWQPHGCCDRREPIATEEPVLSTRLGEDDPSEGDESKEKKMEAEEIKWSSRSFAIRS
jgi:hypothetical protein